jgi:MFS transporter, DHA1 family, multidrug resistance protein
MPPQTTLQASPVKLARSAFSVCLTLPNFASQSPAQPPKLPMSQSLVVLVLALLLGTQPVTTDLYLPALPAMTAGFGASMAQAQLTLSALLLAFGCSQLIWGPLSDRFGRRPVLLVGLVAYVAASTGATFAATMDLLVAWRVVQGVAMGAVVVCARAIVRDLYEPTEGARVMSKGLTGLGVLACFSAPVGGVLAALLGWRYALFALAVFGCVALGLIALRFKETLPTKNLFALQPATLVSIWKSILGNRTFLAYSALSAASYGGLFTFLATSSFVFIQVLGLSNTAYGGLMFINSVFYILGTFLCRHWLPKFGVQKSVALGAFFTLAGGSGMGILAQLDVSNVWTIMVPQAAFMIGHGIHQPCSQSGAVGPFPNSAGAASALNGFGMMVVAFAVGAYLGTHMDGTVKPLTHGVWFWSMAIALVAWTLVRLFGGQTAAPKVSARVMP